MGYSIWGQRESDTTERVTLSLCGAPHLSHPYHQMRSPLALWHMPRTKNIVCFSSSYFIHSFARSSHYEGSSDGPSRGLSLPLLCCCSVAQLCPTLRPHGGRVGRKASLSFTIFRSLHKLMFIESMMPSNHPLSSPSPPAFSLSQQQDLFQ